MALHDRLAANSAERDGITEYARRANDAWYPGSVRVREDTPGELPSPPAPQCHMYCPPLTEKIWPVMKLGSGSARNWARSSFELNRSTPTGCDLGQQIKQLAFERVGERGKGGELGLSLTALDQRHC